MFPITILTLSFLLFLLPLTSSSLLDADDNVTAYGVLQSYGFPRGILPTGVTGYELDESTGKFKAFFNGSCRFSLEGSYDLKYKSTIGGIISKGRLRNVIGVSVKVFFIWLNIVEVYRTEHDLGFSVGIASAEFPINNFEISPRCGCGMDCNGVGDADGDGGKQARKIITIPFVSAM